MSYLRSNFSGVDGGHIDEALALLHAGLDALAGADLTRLDSISVAHLLEALERIRRRLEATDLGVLREADARWVAGEYGQTSTVELLMQALRLSPGEARARIERAADLGPNRAVTGEPILPLYPHAAQALAAGEISVEHTLVIRRALADLERIPRLDPAAIEVAEKLLVDAAWSNPPRFVARLGAELRDRLDPDGPEPREAGIERNRSFDIRRRRDGSIELRARLTSELGDKWMTILDPLSEPIRAEDGTPDDRSATQRRHDAFGECADRLLRSGTLPSAGGTPVTVVVRVDWRDYLRAYGAVPQLQPVAGATGDLFDGRQTFGDRCVDPLGRPVRRAGRRRRVAGRLSRRGELRGHRPRRAAVAVPARARDLRSATDHGHHQRHRRRARPRHEQTPRQPPQRLALSARDGGCNFPGCTRPPAWCEAHHVVPWQAGGPTDLVNLCLLCRFHHRQFDGRGWDVIMVDGHPEWIPPPWLDPAQRPRRNTAHHPPELAFAR